MLATAADTRLPVFEDVSSARAALQLVAGRMSVAISNKFRGVGCPEEEAEIACLIDVAEDLRDRSPVSRRRVQDGLNKDTYGVPRIRILPARPILLALSPRQSAITSANHLCKSSHDSSHRVPRLFHRGWLSRLTEAADMDSRPRQGDRDAALLRYSHELRRFCRQYAASSDAVHPHLPVLRRLVHEVAIYAAEGRGVETSMQWEEAVIQPFHVRCVALKVSLHRAPFLNQHADLRCAPIKSRGGILVDVFNCGAIIHERQLPALFPCTSFCAVFGLVSEAFLLPHPIKRPSRERDLSGIGARTCAMAIINFLAGAILATRALAAPAPGLVGCGRKGDSNCPEGFFCQPLSFNFPFGGICRKEKTIPVSALPLRHAIILTFATIARTTSSELIDPPLFLARPPSNDPGLNQACS
ncbi:hypothetical protein BDK51DRAFT_45863 [Blyttiomyces helicus]|uniref:Uncharacterized protein n=1 Tax=Blyttiomyces helicus TaxID=388810 RepID=A0A4V1IRU7_9FUNG|nr:hypothetical protein BDK51DRAFT_45863 [Blyttiomyces helicus]|eukprot:RKO91297.1 hypothetical protein BDK51DRAFT_45863 [Blyttiomyces helicus]